MKKLIASRQYLIKAVSISIAIGFTGIPSAFGQEIIKGPLADAKSIKTEDDTILNLRFSPSGKLLAWHNSQGLTVRSLDPKSVGRNRFSAMLLLSIFRLRLSVDVGTGDWFPCLGTTADRFASRR